MKFHMGIAGDHARQAYAQLPGVCRKLPPETQVTLYCQRASD